MAVQTNAVGDGFGTQQTAARRLADVGSADPQTVGRVNVKIEQARGGHGGFDSQRHRLDLIGVGGGSGDTIWAECIFAVGQDLTSAEPLAEFPQSPGEQRGAAGQRFVGAGHGAGNGHQRGGRPVQQRCQRRLAGIAGGQQFRP